MEARIIDLEVKLSFMEETVEALNGVILEQAAAIEALNKKLERLDQRVSKDGGDVGPQDERPPHY